MKEHEVEDYCYGIMVDGKLSDLRALPESVKAFVKSSWREEKLERDGQQLLCDFDFQAMKDLKQELAQDQEAQDFFEACKNHEVYLRKVSAAVRIKLIGK